MRVVWRGFVLSPTYLHKAELDSRSGLADRATYLIPWQLNINTCIPRVDRAPTALGRPDHVFGLVLGSSQMDHVWDQFFFAPGSPRRNRITEIVFLLSDSGCSQGLFLAIPDTPLQGSRSRSILVPTRFYARLHFGKRFGPMSAWVGYRSLFKPP